MRLIAGLAAAATITAVAAVPASAAKKKPRPVPKSCNVVFDDAGDASLDSNIPSDDSLDIVGGDFASNGKKITGVIKVKALQAQNPRSPLGQLYFAIFTVKGNTTPLTLSATLAPTGTVYSFGYQGEDPTTKVNTSYTVGTAVGKITGNEIKISANIAAFPQKASLKNGNPVTSLVVETRTLAGQRAVPSQEVGPVRVPLGGGTLLADEATAKKYTLGAPSCVTHL
ncbi:MAG TPA: hypothetical protein VNA20_11545 [Frankiaceae bacterium]|nr:hypothetical protein [Frankiaceae bacterium]